LRRVTATIVDDSLTPANCIRVQQLELNLRIGVTDSERANPQRITINLAFWPKKDFSELKDDIAHAIDYVELCRSASKCAGSRHWKLIETLCSELTSCLLAEFPIKAVEVEIRKYVLPNTAYVSATARKQTPA
jgi:FolB domain-containing protein